MRPPKLIKPYVISFARQILRADAVDLFYVPRQPISGAALNDCFATVAAHVAGKGGAAVLGWALWERPNVYIEAELHTVWQAPGGEYVDISPRPVQIPRTLFLRDPARTYRGVQVDNIRKPLCTDKDVKRFLELAAVRYSLLNEGELRNYHGAVSKTPEMAANDREIVFLEKKIIARYGLWLPENLG